jgi:hypothetical protein
VKPKEVQAGVRQLKTVDCLVMNNLVEMRQIAIASTLHALPKNSCPSVDGLTQLSSSTIGSI